MSPRRVTPPVRRMNGENRKELVLLAATRAFAQGGYAGTSTDAVAKLAGVSQPYALRLFGSKLDMFVAVFKRACDTIRAAFEEVLADAPFDPERDDDWERLGAAYTELLRDRDLLMVLMHGFAAGSEPLIAHVGRDGMGAIYAAIMATGCTEERAMEFVAQGMLLNVMLSIQAPTHLEESSALTPLTRCAFGDALELLT